jgi:hypothetical protein
MEAVRWLEGCEGAAPRGIRLNSSHFLSRFLANKKIVNCNFVNWYIRYADLSVIFKAIKIIVI